MKRLLALILCAMLLLLALPGLSEPAEDNKPVFWHVQLEPVEAQLLALLQPGSPVYAALELEQIQELQKPDTLEGIKLFLASLARLRFQGCVSDNLLSLSIFTQDAPIVNAFLSATEQGKDYSLTSDLGKFVLPVPDSRQLADNILPLLTLDPPALLVPYIRLLHQQLALLLEAENDQEGSYSLAQLGSFKARRSRDILARDLAPALEALLERFKADTALQDAILQIATSLEHLDVPEYNAEAFNSKQLILELEKFLDELKQRNDDAPVTLLGYSRDGGQPVCLVFDDQAVNLASYTTTRLAILIEEQDLGLTLTQAARFSLETGSREQVWEKAIAQMQSSGYAYNENSHIALLMKHLPMGHLIDFQMFRTNQPPIYIQAQNNMLAFEGKNSQTTLLIGLAENKPLVRLQLQRSEAGTLPQPPDTTGWPALSLDPDSEEASAAFELATSTLPTKLLGRFFRAFPNTAEQLVDLLALLGQ